MFTIVCIEHDPVSLTELLRSASVSFSLSTKALSTYQLRGCHLKRGLSWCRSLKRCSAKNCFLTASTSGLSSQCLVSILWIKRGNVYINQTCSSLGHLMLKMWIDFWQTTHVSEFHLHAVFWIVDFQNVLSPQTQGYIIYELSCQKSTTWKTASVISISSENMNFCMSTIWTTKIQCIQLL